MSNNLNDKFQITYTTIPYAPSPMWLRLVYRGPTSNNWPRITSAFGLLLTTPLLLAPLPLPSFILSIFLYFLFCSIYNKMCRKIFSFLIFDFKCRVFCFFIYLYLTKLQKAVVVLLNMFWVLKKQLEVNKIKINTHWINTINCLCRSTHTFTSIYFVFETNVKQNRTSFTTFVLLLLLNVLYRSVEYLLYFNWKLREIRHKEMLICLKKILLFTITSSSWNIDKYSITSIITIKKKTTLTVCNCIGSSRSKWKKIT